MSTIQTAMHRLSAGVILLGALALVGCGAASGGETIVKYTHGEDPGPLVSAPHSGTYALYFATDTTPQVRTHVDTGQKIGFEREGGTVTAVAADYRKLLPNSVLEAFWKYMKEDK